MLSILQLYTNFNDSANIETIITWYPHHKNHHCLLLPVPSPTIGDVRLTRPIAPGKNRASGHSMHSLKKRKDRRCSRLYLYTSEQGAQYKTH